MRILIVGAGAIGGYFGGRLVEKGEDVTFLVRPNRQRQLLENGLVIQSRHGDYTGHVKTILSGEKTEPFDLIVLSVKSYHLDQAIRDIHSYVGDSTVILPLLNGYQHFAVLREVFGSDKILGGLSFIETTVDRSGRIVQTSERHDLVFGEWGGSSSEPTQSILKHLQQANFTVTLSDYVQTDIWHKYIFITSMSGITTLMRSPIGPILANRYGKATFEKLLTELVSIANLIAAPVADNIAEQTLATMEAVNDDMKASMQRDMEKNLPIEADHLQGAWLSMAEAKGKSATNYPVLQAVYANLKIYEMLSNTR